MAASTSSRCASRCNTALNPALVVVIEFVEEGWGEVHNRSSSAVALSTAMLAAARGGMAAHSGSDRSLTAISITGIFELPHVQPHPSRAGRGPPKGQIGTAMATVKCSPTGCCNSWSQAGNQGTDAVSCRPDYVPQTYNPVSCRNLLYLNLLSNMGLTPCSLRSRPKARLEGNRPWARSATEHGVSPVTFSSISHLA